MAPNYRRRVVIIVSAAALWGAGLIWLAFQRNLLDRLGPNSLFLIILGCFGIPGIFGCYYVAKRQPGIRIGIAAVAIVSALCLAAILLLLLKVNNAWTGMINGLIEILLPLSCVILIWQSVRKARDQKRRQE
ncbi:MAG: hypothetical protein WBW84_08300 [Acidobacteriaceae bacterium]